MKKLFIAIFILICAGLLFSGYLSATRLLSGSCAFNEPCPYFLGYPACWYGFAMYLIMFVVTLLGFMRMVKCLTVIKTDLVISAIGIVFAGSFVIQEIARSSLTGPLGFSTCVYGLVFYIAIFILSIVAWKKYPTARECVSDHLRGK